MSATVRACVPYGIAKQGHMRYRRQRLICVAAAEGSTAGDGGDGMRGDGQAGPGRPSIPRGSIVPPALVQSTASAVGGAGFVDVRMFEQVEKSRARLSQRLVEEQRANGFLREVAEAREDEATQAAELLLEASQEISSAMRLARRTADVVRFGVDRTEMLRSMAALMDRLEVLNETMADTATRADAMRTREVPIEWQSPATEVRVVGSFDNWTTGVELSPDFIEDSVLTRFSGSLKLRPGKYYVKFLVDNEWRLAPDWAIEQDSAGNECNVILIEASDLKPSEEAKKAIKESTPPLPESPVPSEMASAQ